VHRLPAPPSASVRGLATVAAVAAGAIVAAGQSLASLHAADDPVDEAYSKLASNAMIPVADDGPTQTPGRAPTVVPAIGANQLGGAVAAVDQLDPRSEVDVASLTKAAEIGDRIKQEAGRLRKALAAGAPQGVLFAGTAYVLPTVGRYTSGFGARWGVTHYGIDLANSIGTPIFAVTDGVVEESGPASGFGMWVVLRHTDGTHSVYGHINRALVTVGQKVTAGQEIAEMGNRGQSTGPHLHFEIWLPGGAKINPIPWLAARGIVVPGTGDGPAHD
jgi:murein DD-endopeptidase MepM/ murein hydrolase activator NlpD